MGLINALNRLLFDKGYVPNHCGGAAHSAYQARSLRCVVCGKKLVHSSPYDGASWSSPRMASGGYTQSGGKIWCLSHPVNSANFCVHGFLLKNNCEFCPEDERQKHMGDTRY